MGSGGCVYVRIVRSQTSHRERTPLLQTYLSREVSLKDHKVLHTPPGIILSTCEIISHAYETAAAQRQTDFFLQKRNIKYQSSSKDI